MDKYAAGAKALYEFNQTLVKDKVSWDAAKINVRIMYWKRAKIVIEAYEADIAR